MTLRLSENINTLMLSKNLSADELSRRTHLPASTIKKIRRDPKSNPTLYTLNILARYFGITISQLVGEIPIEKPPFRLPVIGWREALNWQIARSTKMGYRIVTTDYPCSKNSFALSVSEDDWKNLPKDTILIIDPTLQAKHRDLALIHKANQTLPQVKQIIFEDNQIYLRSVIHDQHIVPQTNDDMILGIIVETKKSYITI